MKSLIVSTDYSDAAQNAVEYAASLAQYINANVILFHAFHLPVPTTGVPFLFPDIDEIITENNQRLEIIGKELVDKYDINVKCISRPAFVVDELSELVKQYNADLVVLGMRGASLDYKLFGSITTAVIKEVKFPVLVIPQDATFQKIDKILLASDYRCISETNKLGALKELASAFSAKIQILHVEKPEMVPTVEVEQSTPGPIKMDEVFEGVNHEYRFLEDEDVVKGIERGVKEFKADILAMVPHDHGFWGSLLHKSITRKMVLKSHVPLLSIPNS
jgi:nucleotide-binding universal stress UspA family protein